MNTVNLLPRHRLRALRAQRRLRKWCVGLGVYAAALSGAFAGASALAPPPAQAIERSLVRAERLIARRQSELQRRQAASRQLASDLRVADAVGRQPDWSVLLRVVGRAMGDRVAMSAWAVEPSRIAPAARDASSPPVLQEPDSYTLRIVAVAPGQSFVTDAILRLEDTGLFDTVRLEGSRQDARGENTFVSFTLVAGLRADTKPATTEPAS